MKKLSSLLKLILNEATIKNYYDKTTGTWEGLSRNETMEFLKEYIAWRRKRNKPEFIEVGGKKYKVDYQSEKKNAFFQSRGFSYYFIENGTDNIVRISDHWSSTGDRFPKSRKLNCGMIASCYWDLDGGDKVDVKIPGEKYSSSLIGGKISASDLNTSKE